MLKKSKREILERLRIINQYLYKVKNTKRTSKEAIMIIEKNLLQITKKLNKLADVFIRPDYKLLELKKIAKELRSICKQVYASIIHAGVEFQSYTVLIMLAKSLNDCGCHDYATKLFLHILERATNYSEIADLVDKTIECGLLDIALEGLKKLRKMGFSYFEIVYNEALINYLIGRDLEAFRLLKLSLREFGEKRQLLGLLVAVNIALGFFDEAKEILMKIRGH